MANNIFDKAAFCYVGSVNGWFDRPFKVCRFVFAVSPNIAPDDDMPGRRARLRLWQIFHDAARGLAISACS